MYLKYAEVISKTGDSFVDLIDSHLLNNLSPKKIDESDSYYELY